MDQLKESLRLRWQLMGSPREKWRLRWKLLVAIVRLRRADLHMRVCVIRYCVAIYRRELATYQRETAVIEADYWKGAGDEELD